MPQVKRGDKRATSARPRRTRDEPATRSRTPAPRPRPGSLAAPAPRQYLTRRGAPSAGAGAASAATPNSPRPVMDLRRTKSALADRSGAAARPRQETTVVRDGARNSQEAGQRARRRMTTRPPGFSSGAPRVSQVPHARAPPFTTCQIPRDTVPPGGRHKIFAVVKRGAPSGPSTLSGGSGLGGQAQTGRRSRA